MSTVSPAALPSPSTRSIRLSRLSDELLARQASRGSGRAVSVLYERYHQALYRYCRSIVRDDADAQDALQSTFTGALAALKRGTRTAPLRPWLYRIAHNESISLLRRRQRDAQPPLIAEPSALTSAASAEEEAADRARWRRVVADLAELPERQRGALLLRELAGLSHEEIGLALGLTIGAAKQAIFEARQGLAELEEGRSMGCEEVRRRISEGDRRVLRARRVRAHLRDCTACGAFAVSIPSRQSDLRALAPGLPPAAAAAMLSRVIGAAAPSGGTSAAAGSAAGVAGKAVVGWKALAVAGVLAGTAAGVTGLAHAVRHARPVRHPVAHSHRTRIVPGRPVSGSAVGGGAVHAAGAPGADRAHHQVAARHRARENGAAQAPRSRGAANPSPAHRGASGPGAAPSPRSGTSPGHVRVHSAPGRTRHAGAGHHAGGSGSSAHRGATSGTAHATHTPKPIAPRSHRSASPGHGHGQGSGAGAPSGSRGPRAGPPAG